MEDEVTIWTEELLRRALLPKLGGDGHDVEAVHCRARASRRPRFVCVVLKEVLEQNVPLRADRVAARVSI